MLNHLLALADAYQLAEEVPDTTLSWRVFNDSKKLAALRGGSDLHTKRCEAAIQWFSDHWPDKAVWPEEIDRPDSATPEPAAAA